MIGANLAATLTNIVTALNASVDAAIAEATYGESGGNTLTITFDTLGGIGNAFRIMAGTSPATNGTASGATLSGGLTSHEYQSGSWTLPSLSIEKGMPEVPYYALITGVVANQLSWQMQRSGLVTATLGCIAQKELVDDAAATGVLNELPLTRFGAFSGAIKRDGVSLGNVVSGQITYTNNLDRIETIRSDGAIDGADPSMAALTGNVELRFADLVLTNQAIAGGACELEFSYDLGAAGSLKWVAHEVFLPKPRLSITGPAGVQASFAWQGARDAVLGRMATVTLINDVAVYTNP